MEFADHFNLVHELIQHRAFAELLKHDQLSRSIETGKALVGFHEAPINFAPTFKLHRGNASATAYQHKRIPSWCDRVLWSALSEELEQQIKCTLYESIPSVTTSDHKPVRALF